MDRKAWLWLLNGVGYMNSSWKSLLYFHNADIQNFDPVFWIGWND